MAVISIEMEKLSLTGTEICKASEGSGIPFPTIVQAEIDMESDLDRSVTASRSESYWGEWLSWREARAAKIEEICGKYRDVLSPSDEFARQKRAEMDLED